VSLEGRELEYLAEKWLAKLPSFVQAVTVSGEDFLAGTGIPFDPTEWQEGHRLTEWTVMSVTETSVRFRRNDILV